MTAPDRSTSSTAFSASFAVGIDVSKASLKVVLLPGEERGSASRSVPNTDEGFEQLFEWIDQHTEGTLTEGTLEESPKQVHVCLEASGGYERPVARFLYERGLTISVVNPRRTSAYANSRLSRSKTDRVDARLLARFCRREEPSRWRPASSEQRGLKEMTRGLEGLKKERDRLNNQIDRSSNPTVTGSLQSVLESVNEQIDRLEEAIDQHVQNCQPLARKRDLLETIPGIGPTTAALVIAELGNPDRFESARVGSCLRGPHAGSSHVGQFGSSKTPSVKSRKRSASQGALLSGDYSPSM